MSRIYGVVTRDLRTLQPRLLSRCFSISHRHGQKGPPAIPNHLVNLLDGHLNDLKNLKPDDSEDQGRYSYRSRREQNKKPAKPKDHSIAPLPDWFIQQNVILHEEQEPNSPLRDALGQFQKLSNGTQSRIEANVGPFHYRPRNSQPAEDKGCCLDVIPLLNLLFNIKGSISSELHKKLPFTHACCPHPGGIDFLKSLTNDIGNSISADVVHLSIQDISELAEQFVKDLPETERTFEVNKTRKNIEELAFAAYKPYLNETNNTAEEEAEENPLLGIPGIRLLNQNSSRRNSFPFMAIENDSDEVDPRLQRYEKDYLQVPAIKSFFKSIVLASSRKRGANEIENGSKPLSHFAKDTNPIILCISDFGQITSEEFGVSLLLYLTRLVHQLRRSGYKITVVGLSSLNQATKASWTAMEEEMTSEPLNTFYQTAIIPPVLTTGLAATGESIDISNFTNEAEHSKNEWENLQFQRTMQINLRSIFMTLDLSTDNDFKRKAITSIINDPKPAHDFVKQKLGDHIWSQNEVWATSLLFLGIRDVVPGLDNASEIARVLHFAAILGHLIDIHKKRSIPKEDQLSKQATSDKGLGISRSKLNKHERGFLSGIIDTSSIHTTFDQVHTSPDTVESLRTITSLSLSRPDAFSYGILQKEHLPGLLLYGPPGTGKTLLAKAVAKEANAKVLMVSGGSIFDRYFGESERKITALFSLARKIAPCVIFIDEADALFVSRGGNGNQMHHFYTNIVNQFLREIEMHFQTPDPARPVVLMVATNRPYAIDDAILRRLPRRILVDLPTEQDRSAILNILLADEQVADDVSVADIAARTPLYSGSDLKSVVVAAALTAVREETTTGGPWHQKRVLTKDHFEQALGEISASISDDMESLKDLKKFDEKYGDRKGRKEKQGLGFGELNKGVEQSLARIRG
jgi:ATP-dependent 26S proteasome regulatory subunit